MDYRMSKRVLVVDDEEAIRELCRQLFEREGYEVLTAASAEEAMRVMRDTPAPVLFLDLNMPDMNGMELCRQLRVEWPEIVCYAVTGNAFFWGMTDYKAAGFEDFLCKPVGSKQLLGAAAKAFARLKELCEAEDAVLQQEQTNHLKVEQTREKPLIMVVDDSPVQRKIISKVLALHNFTVQVFSSVESALGNASESSEIPDLIISDLCMPEIDGWAFCRLLRSPDYKELNVVPILLVSSAYSSTEMDMLVAAHGADGFMSLPLKAEELLCNIKTLLEGKKLINMPRVLIVEDELHQAELLKNVYETRGYEVELAEDEPGALSALECNRYNLALIDYHLPKGSGEQLLIHIKKNYPDCVCIMTTADDQPGLALKWVKNGAAAYVRKPFDLGYLLELSASACRESMLLRKEVQIEEGMQALKDVESHYRFLYESIRDALFVTDADGIFADCNPAFESLFAYTREEIVGQKPELIMAEGDSPVNSVIETGRSEGVQLYNGLFRRKSGESFWGEAHILPMTDSHGVFLGVIGFICDKTEHLVLTEEVDQLKELYRHAQKIEAVGRLASGLAHDLNNLLSPIIGFGELLAEGLSFDDPKKMAAEQILKAGKGARELVRQLQGISRKQPLNVRAICPNSVVEGFQHLLRRTIRENISINYHLTDEPVKLAADSGQIEQILMNLSLNAQDAMPDGGVLLIETAVVELDENFSRVFGRSFGCSRSSSCAVTVGGRSVETLPVSLLGRCFMLSVSDTGVGMDEVLRDRVFEAFFSTKGERGTGLGLATVQSIVSSYGGDIHVYSEKGCGTIFKVYFPLLREQDGSLTDLSVNDDIAVQENIIKGGRGTILLVEDNAQVRQLAESVLVSRGHKVLSCDGPVQALRQMDENKDIHLLLTDVIMPGMTGRELYEKLAEKEPGLGVLYMSGYTSQALSIRGGVYSEHNYIQKPFSVKELSRKVGLLVAEKCSHKL